MSHNLRIYTDGGCWNHTGEGAWAFVVTEHGQEIYSNSGRVAGTTNNEIGLGIPAEPLFRAVGVVVLPRPQGHPYEPGVQVGEGARREQVQRGGRSTVYRRHRHLQDGACLSIGLQAEPVPTSSHQTTSGEADEIRKII